MIVLTDYLTLDKSVVRRAVLGDRFRDGEIGIGNERMLLGNFLQELFQSALQTSFTKKLKITAKYLETEMVKLIDESIRAVIACGVGMKVEGTIPTN